MSCSRTPSPATAAAVVRAGADLRFADVSDDTLLITPGSLTEAITPRTHAVIVVHLLRQMPDMVGILAAAKAGICVIEDAAQAHGAEWDGHRTGSFGDAACFSFHPAKNLGAVGDGGAVITSQADLADRVRTLANHGRSHGASLYEYTYVGTNCRLDTLQAVLLSGKPAFLDAWTQRRIELAARYREVLCGTGLRHTGVCVPGRATPITCSSSVSPSAMRSARNSPNVASIPVCTIPCHVTGNRQPPLLRFADRPLPVTEQMAGELLSLPMFPHLTDGQVDFVGEALSILQGMAAGPEFIDVQ